MKNKLILIISLLFIGACSNPEKEGSSDKDSLLNETGHDSILQQPILTDTLTFDSLKAESVFNKNDSQTYFLLANYLTKPEVKPPSSDIQLIDSTCAIIVYPTDEQLKTLQDENGDNFMTLADTYSYYQGSAIEMLDSIDIGTINAEKRYLTFKGRKARSWELDIRKDGAPAWNLIFFNVSKEPEIISVTDLSHNRIIEYFNKKAE